MPKKYLSGRVERTPQTDLTDDRYEYLGLDQTEPNLGDPLVGPSSITAKPVPPGQQYIVVSTGIAGERYWIPNQGGIIPGSISVFNENTGSGLVGGLSSTTQLVFIGTAVTVTAPYAGPPYPPNVNITISPPGNNGEVLFKELDDFATSTKLVFNSSVGILTIGVGNTGVKIDGTTGIITSISGLTTVVYYGDGSKLSNIISGVSISTNTTNQNQFLTYVAGTGSTTGFGITTTGLVFNPSTTRLGIGTTNPTQELHIQGNLKLTGTVYDYNNQPGTNQQVLIKNNFGGLTWVNQSSIGAGAGGTYQNIQYHNSAGLVDGASNFVFDENNNRVGIGSTFPRYILDVIGTVNINGLATITNLYVSGISTLGVTSTTNFTSQSLFVSGISTFYGNILPGSNGVYDIGNVSYQFDEIYANTFVGGLLGNAGTATKLSDARTIAITGDLAYTSPAFDGSSNVTAAGTLSTTGVTSTTYGSSTQVPVFAVDAKGRITSVTNTGVNFTTATVAQANGLTTARTIAITGDLAYTSPAFDGTGNVTGISTLATVNSNVGTFGSSTFVPQITVNAKGLVTGISSVGVNFTTATVSQANSLTTARTIAITGDLTYTSPAFDGSSNVTATGTLAATTVVAGSYGSGSQVATFTVDAKGRLTAASSTSITGINASSVAAAGGDTQVQFNDGGTFAGDADFTFAKTTNTVTTRFLALNGNGSTTSAQLTFNGGTNNWITFGTTGVAAPAFTARSVGTKIVLYDGIGASSADYSFGIESSTLWSSVPTTSQQFRWYGGTTIAATLSGAGAFTAVGAISGTQLNGTLQYTLTLNTSGTGLSGSTTYNNSGAATFTVTSNATSANTASAIVARDGNGDFSARYINSSYFNSTDDISAGTLSYLMGKFGDNYHRSATAAKVATFISGQTMNINGSSASCNGNAATATNVAYSGLTGTVPTWNQNTTGNATTATTATNVVGTSGRVLYNNGTNSTTTSANLTFDGTNLVCGGTVTASSDEKLKENIQTIENALDKVMNLRGVEYDRKDSGEHQIGVIAQEVEKVIPEVVYGDEIKSVAYGNLVGLLIESIKELTEKVERLEKNK